MKKTNELIERPHKKRVNITVDPELWAVFQKRCSEQGLSASFMVEKMARDFVESKKQIRLI